MLNELLKNQFLFKNAMRKCVVCGASSQDYSLFKFPSNEPYRTEWKKFANLTIIANVTSYRLCIRHFSEDAIFPSHQPKDGEPSVMRRRIRKTAIPTMNKPCNENAISGSHVKKSTKPLICLICKKRTDGMHFQFPKNLQIRNEWLRLCGYSADFFNGDKQWYLCSAHFRECDISVTPTLNGPMKSRLRKNVKPSLLLPVLKSSTAEVPTLGKRKTFFYETIPGYKFILPNIGSCIITVNNNKSAVSCNKSLAESPAIESSKNCNSESTIESSRSCNSEKAMEPSKNCNSENMIESFRICKSESMDESPMNCNSKGSNESSRNCESESTTITMDEPSHSAVLQSSIETTPATSRSAAKRRIRYAGDIKTSDIATPESARQCIEFLKNEVKKYRRKNDILSKRNRRLQKIVETYKSIVGRL